MIGIYLSWQRQGIAPDIASRFVSSFSVGTGAHVGQSLLGNTIVISTCANATAARNWLPQKTQCNETLLFHGYISNRNELRSSLGNDLRTDADLYRAGYNKWGRAVDLRAIGAYSAIIVDPDERSVQLIRTPIEAPPLHIWHDQNRAIIATTPRAVFATGEISPEIDEQKIADSLLLNYQEEERSWYKNVSRLRTGHRGSVTHTGLATESFYDLRSLADVRLKSDQDYVEAANSLLNEATKAALDGFSRPAISVSGGFDSQAVTAFSVQNMPKGQRLLGLTSVPERSWVNNDTATRFGDESSHVEALKALYPEIDVEWVDAHGLSFDHKLQAMFLAGSIAPRNAMNLHWLHEIWSRAKSRHCDVILTGSMGNATFSFDGEGMLPDLFSRRKWSKLLSELLQTPDQRSLPHKFATQVAMPFAPDWAVGLIRRLKSGNSSEPLESWCPLQRDYAREMDVFNRAKDMDYDSLYRPFKSTKSFRDIMFSNAMNESGDVMHALEQIHGIPSRDPTAYRPLVEFCYAIPDDQYWQKGERRWLAKRMLKGKVPEMVLSEKRRGLQAADWELRLKRQSDDLRAELDRMSDYPAMARRLDIKGLALIMDQWLAGTKLDENSLQRLKLALPRALTTARFIRFVEGSNDG